jgi:hypothetical protein
MPNSDTAVTILENRKIINISDHDVPENERQKLHSWSVKREDRAGK